LVNPGRIKKTIVKWKAKWITDDTRITIIGCTSEPHNGSKKDFKKFFDRSIYFPYPDYTTSRQMWRSFIEMNGGILESDFPLHTLAHVSKGYSAGSIKKACEWVLTPHRITTMVTRPLKLSEFIGPLSLCLTTDLDQYDEFKSFTDFVSGDGLRRKQIEMTVRGQEENENSVKNKKLKKKKKNN